MGQHAFVAYDDYIDSGQFVFPVGDDARDDRLAPSALVVGISVGDTTAAYPVDGLDGPVNDEVADQPVVIFPNEGGAVVYSPLLDGQRLEFERRGDELVDTSTGSSWTSRGVAVSGPLEGSALEPVPSRTTFWFAMVGAFPDVILVR